MTQRQNSVTQGRDTSSRARTPLRGYQCHVTGDATVTRDAFERDAAGRDVPGAPLRSDPVTITPGEVRSGFEEKTKAHAAKLATDPRFAGWLGLMPNERTCCGTFDGSVHRATCTAQDRAVALMSDGDPDPAIGEAAARRAEESIELLRRAKYSFLCWAQRNPEADPREVQAARDFLDRHQPLQRPLGAGQPPPQRRGPENAAAARVEDVPGIPQREEQGRSNHA